MRGFIIAISIAVLCYATGVHQSVLGLFGVGGARFGISSSDPLGIPEKIHGALTREGYVGEFGSVNKPRTIKYQHPYDDKLYSGIPSVIIVTVGEEEYVQKIDGVFFGSQHGMAPRKPTMVEQDMVALWRAVGGPKTDFRRVEDKPFTIPWSVKTGKALAFPQHHMESPFSTAEVKGDWLYDETYPQEVITLSLR